MKPDIYFFNPTCELAVANGSMNFMASAQLRRFENELSTLPGIFAGPEDIILTDRIPAQKFTDQLESAGFRLPTFKETESALSDPVFLSGEKGFLYPWGWSPAAHKLLSPLKSGCCPEFLDSPVAEWHEIHRELYSRKSALTILQHIINEQNSDILLPYSDLPEICTSHEQIIALQQKWGKVVVKAPWSSSGRGLQILRPNEYNRTNRQVITGFLKQQGFVVVEPWHNKVHDLSFQFFSFGNGIIEYRGLTSFSTDHLGRYVGNFIQELPPDLTPELNEFLHENLPNVKQALLQELTSSNYSTDYYGWLGVDALIFESSDENLKIHICLEINCRFTMGAIALSLRTHLEERSIGKFRITNGKEGYFAQFCKEMMNKEPLIVESGKIVSGFLPVTPTSPESSFGAYISVKEMKELLILPQST
ncbi:MAG: hypothetical protein NTY07_14180 [Bacteroidia bacterium]|nr:hypothetical protein [Bacteroidia bacterium]